MSSSELKIEAKERLLGKRKEAAIVILLFMVVTSVLGGLSGSYNTNNQNIAELGNNSAVSISTQQQSPAQVLGKILFAVVNTFLSLGMTSYFLKISRGEDVKIEELWSKGKLLPKAIVVGIIRSVVVFVGCLAFIIPGIILSFGYTLTTYLLIDNPDMEILDVLKNSRTMMKGNKWRYFCLVISFIGWFLLLIPTFGLLSLWLLPYVDVACCAFYNNLIGKGGVEKAVEAEVVEGE
ncbi:MAG: DUF975 family protein [Clostridia bacterium]|nr:DUF975 family protein [Clostridia bacterium]